MNPYFKNSRFVTARLLRYFSMAKTVNLNFVKGSRTIPVKSLRLIEKCDPATGAHLFNIACTGEKDVDYAVKSAQQAFLKWSKKSPRERGQVLSKAAKMIMERIEEIAHAEVKDTGKPIWEARVDVSGCADVFEYYGGIAATISGSHHQVSDGNFALVQREPLGVVAGIGAWNYPFQVMSWKAAPALACGNTFVYKPSELTPTTSVLLAEILTTAGLPDGAVNVLQGGSETGEFMCKHPDISKVSFTGSVATGQKIIKLCSDTMKKVTMELGGKSALIVFQDSDITNSVKATLLGNFLTQGEVCSNCTRVYVHKDILEKFTCELVSATKNLKIGDPFKKDTKVGAIINESHAKKIMDFLQLARKEGAHVACGGEKVTPDEDNLKGFFISPCILTNCSDDMQVVKEEIFGPVVCILPFESESEAVARANASPYGLAAGVFTRDVKKAHRVAAELQAGIVWINNYNVFPPEVPFGGYKMSGYGRENGIAALNEYTQLKTVFIEMNESIDCPLYTEK